ncbi:MAG: phage tail sheath family protein [Clostridium sp.]
MAGGNFINQDKTLPGAYINVTAKKLTTVEKNENGIATVPLTLSWGKESTVLEITRDNCKEVLGLDVENVVPIREVLRLCNKVLVYRLNTGVAARKLHGTLTFIAACSGLKGNSITVVIQQNIVTSSKWDIITLFEGIQVDKQTIGAIGEFKPNKYITVEGTGSITASAGVVLEGGTDGTVTNADYTRYLAAIELYKFDAIGVATTDEQLKATVANFAKRLNETEGKKIQCVLSNYPQADYEGVSSVNNGVQLPDRTLTAVECVYFFTGATAGAAENKSNTYQEYPTAIDVVPRYTTTELTEIVKNGEIVFSLNNGRVVIEKDINTLKTIGPTKNKDFKKNRIIRTLDGICNDAKYIWDTKYIGKVDNNDNGRSLYTKSLIEMMENKQKIGAIEGFVVEDIVVSKGLDKDSVVVEIAVQPVDAMEKLYMRIEVQ